MFLFGFFLMDFWIRFRCYFPEEFRNRCSDVFAVHTSLCSNFTLLYFGGFVGAPWSDEFFSLCFVQLR